MRTRTLSVLVLVSLVTLFLSACGDDTPNGPNGGELGSFEITYGGDVSGTISGPAFFLEHEFQGETTGFSVFGIEVEHQEDGFAIVRTAPQPEPGTYDIHDSRTGEPAEGEFGLTIYEDTKNLSVDAIDGTVTFNQSNADRVRGSFEATLVGSMSGTDVTISATGSFEAVSCEDNVANCPPSF